jgi:hypothetical protein
LTPCHAERNQEYFEAIKEADIEKIRSLLVENKSLAREKKRIPELKWPEEIEQDGFRFCGAYLGAVTGLQYAVSTNGAELARGNESASEPVSEGHIECSNTLTCYFEPSLRGERSFFFRLCRDTLLRSERTFLLRTEPDILLYLSRDFLLSILDPDIPLNRILTFSSSYMLLSFFFHATFFLLPCYFHSDSMLLSFHATFLPCYFFVISTPCTQILLNYDEIALTIADATLSHDIDIPFGGSNTALHLACLVGDKSLVQVLLARGASTDHRNSKGFNPLSICDDPEGWYRSSVEIVRIDQSQLTIPCHVHSNELVRFVISVVLLEDHSPNTVFKIRRQLLCITKDSNNQPLTRLSCSGRIAAETTRS